MNDKPGKSLEDRRQRILSAARRVFQEKGGLGAGLRPIAAEAGVTTGAIYAVFANREEIYAALQDDALRQVATAVRIAADAEADPVQSLRAAATAFHEYYRDHPFEFQLGVYAFKQESRQDLTRELGLQLNARLMESITVMARGYQRLGVAPEDAQDKAKALFAAMVGVTLMHWSRRDRSIGTSTEKLFQDILRLHIPATLPNI